MKFKRELGEQIDDERLETQPWLFITNEMYQMSNVNYYYKMDFFLF